MPQESLFVSAARAHLQLSRERRVAESALSCSNAASLKITGSFRSNQNKRFGHAETQIWTRPLRIPWFCRNYSESTAHGARQIAISRRLLCASRARYRISFQPSRAGTVPSSPGVISNCFLCGWVGGDTKLAVFLVCSLLIFRCTVFGRLVGFWRVAFASLTHTDSRPLRGCLIKATLFCACSFSIQVLLQVPLLIRSSTSAALS